MEINSDFKVILKQGPVQQVQLSTGENLIDGIKFELNNESFIIRNDNSCKWSRSYEMPTLYVVHPDLHKIIQGGSGLVVSEGVLNYPALFLESRNQSGDFDLEVACDQLTISSNDLSNFYITGESDYLKIGFYSGDGRFEGHRFKVKKAEIYHRGSNDIMVYTTEKLTGRLLSTGNLIYVKTQPSIIEISTENIGRLINRTE